jgi:hypothetical protein
MLEILVQCASGKKAEDFVFTRDDGMHGGTFVFTRTRKVSMPRTRTGRTRRLKVRHVPLGEKGEILRTAPSRSSLDWIGQSSNKYP